MKFLMSYRYCYRSNISYNKMCKPVKDYPLFNDVRFVSQLSQQQQEEPWCRDAIAHAVSAALATLTPHR